MIKVAVSGCAGRMGQTVVGTVRAADDLELVCGIDPHGAEADFPVYPTVAEALAGAAFDVLVDFTQPAVVADNLRVALPAGVDCVVGTTGLSTETLEELAALAPAGTCLFYAPNFTTGAVLMMQFAKAAAPYFPEAEVIEFHHARKLDAPRARRCARPRSSRSPRRPRERGAGQGNPRSRAAKARAARSWTACPCTRCARRATWPARRSSSARSARCSPSGHDSTDRACSCRRAAGHPQRGRA